LASIIIRNLPDGVKEQLRVRAALRGKALEAEVRDMLVQLASSPLSASGNAPTALNLIWPESGFPVPYLEKAIGPMRVDTSRDTLYG
jgi:plasmid stability protein